MPRKSSKKVAKRRNPDAFDEALANAQMAEVQRLAAAHTKDAIHALVEISTATKRKWEPNQDDYFELDLDDENQPIRYAYLPGPRSTAAKALLEHAHGRPNQRAPSATASGEIGITVVLQTFGANGVPVEIDVTPTPERISGGADPPA